MRTPRPPARPDAGCATVRGLPKLKASACDAAQVESSLRDHGYPNAAARVRADLVTVVAADEVDCPRFRLVAPYLWALEMPTHTSRWEKTPFVGTLAEMLSLLVTDFAWTLAEALPDPVRTSGGVYY